MAYIQSISSIAVAAIVLLAVSASAQDANNTIKPVTPEVKLSCVDAESIAFNASEMVGTWYEVSRYPEAKSACVQVHIAPIANTSNVEIHLTFADDHKNLWVNKTAMANVSVADADKASKAGYNISFSINNSSWPTMTYKLLANYTDYIIACGYTNATNNATESGFVLSRERMVNSTVLSHYGEMASANFSNFVNTSMSAVTQSKECLGKNAAVSTLPFLSAIMAAIYALLMLVN